MLLKMLLSCVRNILFYFHDLFNAAQFKDIGGEE